MLYILSGNPWFWDPKVAKKIFFRDDVIKARQKYANLFIFGLVQTRVTLYFNLHVITLNYAFSIVWKTPILGPKRAKKIFFRDNVIKAPQKYANFFIFGLVQTCVTLYFNLHVIKLNYALSIVRKPLILGPKKGKKCIFQR